MFFTSDACDEELVKELSELICELDDFNDEGGVTALLSQVMRENVQQPSLKNGSKVLRTIFEHDWT